MLLINEALVAQFKFWRDGQVQQGMRFRNRLFCQVRSFDRNDREQVFNFSHRLAHAGVEAMITATTSQYTLWVSLNHLESGLSAGLSEV
jgi:uncharacterized membrane protein YhfC